MNCAGGFGFLYVGLFAQQSRTETDLKPAFSQIVKGGWQPAHKAEVAALTEASSSMGAVWLCAAARLDMSSLVLAAD